MFDAKFPLAKRTIAFGALVFGGLLIYPHPPWLGILTSP